MATVSKWRIYCNTEGKWVDSWDITEPSTCRNNTAHSVNLNSVYLLETISSETVRVENTYTDLLQTSRFVQQKTLIDIKSYHGITKENKVTTVGTATVTATSEVDSEIRLNINGTSDECTLRSKQRGFYKAGMASECGIAVRIPQTLDSTQEFKFGYFDDNNGYYFKLIGASLKVGIMKNGVETLIDRDSFNNNKVDGSEGIILDFIKGNIFRITFTWYGFGNVSFGFIGNDISGDQKYISMHTYSTNGSTSCGNPCLPINSKLSSNGSTQNTSVYVAGRQYSILGKIIDNLYENMYHITDTSITDTSTKYLFSMRNKNSYKTCLSKIVKLRALGSTSAIVKILKNATLTGSNFIDNAYVEESCLEVDTSSSFSGGTVCKSFLLFGGVNLDVLIKDMNIYEDDTISIVWNSISGTTTLEIQVDFEEKW